MTTIPTLEEFVAVEGTRFDVRFPDITIPLKLEEAVPLPPPPEPGPGIPDTLRKVPYSLVFSGPVETPLAQNTYRLSHDRLGDVDLVMVPMSRQPEAIYYAVTVN